MTAFRTSRIVLFTALLLALIAVLALVGAGARVAASDHDDGENDMKARSLNLTDLYVFREVDQNPMARDDDLILVMNSNPRSLARQAYPFSSNARYEFNFSRVLDNDAMPTGLAEGVLRFEFGEADENGQQPIVVTMIRDGVERTGSALTTALDQTPVLSEVDFVTAVRTDTLTVFAGLREDPFFFDVEQYFRVRAGAAGFGPAVGFRDPGYDFTLGYNVNSIVVRMPRGFLASPTQSYDFWTTISVPDADGNWQQIERLGRPAINEGLILTHAFNNALNSVGPAFEAAALRGEQPEADIAGPIVAEAVATLKAVGNSDERALTLIGAFLPDVMRIDASAPSGYANALNASGSPMRGRLITDDVIDVTLSVLTDGAITSDHVSYDGPDLTGRGHAPLLTQFPYLAAPN